MFFLIPLPKSIIRTLLPKTQLTRTSINSPLRRGAEGGVVKNTTYTHPGLVNIAKKKRELKSS